MQTNIYREVVIIFKLFSRDEKFLHDFNAIKAINKEVLNGEDILNITVANDLDIKKKQRILYKFKNAGYWKEFIVEQITENRLDGTVEIMAENSIYELFGDFIEDSRAINTTANIALQRALLPTRWEVGTVSALGSSTATFYRTNAKEALDAVARAWRGELRTRVVIAGNKITRRIVDLFSERGGYLGERFVTGENVENIVRTVEDDYVVTALYGFGVGEEIEDSEGKLTGGFGRRIDFSTINAGKMYLEDNEARLKYGRPDGAGGRKHIFGKVEFDDIDDITELKAATALELEKLKNPKVTYQGEIIESAAQLGDTVLLIDNINEPNLRVLARVFEIKHDLINLENSEPVLGNYIDDITSEWNKQSKFIDNIRSKQNIWNRASFIDKDGNIDVDYLGDIIDELNSQMNETGGYFYLTEGEGIITYDKPIDQNPTRAIQIVGGAFRLANSKKANGEWNWRTFGDGDGFVADEFIGGLLKGGKVNFDLTNGTLLIGNSIDDYSLYFDGNNLKIKLSSGKTIEKEMQDRETAAKNYADTQAGQALTDAKAHAETKKDEAITAAELVSKAEAKLAKEEAEATAAGLVGTEKEERLQEAIDNLAAAKEHADTAAGAAQTAANTYAEQKAAEALASAKTHAEEEAAAALANAVADAEGKIQIVEEAMQGVAAAEAALAETRAKDHADAELLAEQTARLKQAQENLQAAKDEAQAFADEAERLAKEYADLQDEAVLEEAQTDAQSRADAALSAAKTDAQTKATAAENAAKSHAEAQATYAKEEAEATAAGLVGTEKAERLQEAIDNLAAAKSHAESQAAAAETAAKTHADTQRGLALIEAKNHANTKAGETLTAAKKDAKEKADAAEAAGKAEAVAKANLAKAEAIAEAEGLVGTERDERVQQALDNLAAAKTHAENKADAAQAAAEEYAELQASLVKVGAKNLVDNSENIAHEENTEMVKIHDGLKRGIYTISFDYIVEKGNPTAFLIYTDRILDTVPTKAAGADRTSKTFEVTSLHAGKPIHMYFGQTAAQSKAAAGEFLELQLEEGNRETGWFPSPNDVNNMIGNVFTTVTENMNTELQATAAGILNTVSGEYTSKSDFESYELEASTKFIQTDSEFVMDFNNTKTRVSGLEDLTATEFEEINSYIKFKDGTIELGKPPTNPNDTALSVLITNNEIQFLENGNKVAYISNNRLYITHGQFLNTLRLGNFTFEPRTNGNLSFRKVN